MCKISSCDFATNGNGINMFLHAISLTKEIQSNSLNFLLQLMLGWKVYLAVRSSLNAHSQWFLFHLKYYVSIERNYHLLQGKNAESYCVPKIDFSSSFIQFHSHLIGETLYGVYNLCHMYNKYTSLYLFFFLIKCLNKSFFNALIRWHDLFVEIKFCS